MRVAGDPEAAAADVARLRPGHGEGEGDGDRGIRGVAALAQDLDADSGRGALFGGDAAARPERGLRQVGGAERGRARARAGERPGAVSLRYSTGPMKSIRDLPLQGRKLFLRVDFNVPLDGGRVSDDTRIVETLPTVRLALERGARVICASHLGKAKGKRKPELSLAPVAVRFAELLGKPVRFVDDCVGPEAARAADAPRARRGAAAREPPLPRRRGGERSRRSRRRSRRSRTSTSTTPSAPRTAPTPRSSACRSCVKEKGAGLLLEKEVRELSRLLEPERPFAAILGGAKISGKIDTLRVLSRRADVLLVGGGMANHFVRALGLSVGRSLLEEDKVALAREILDFCKEAGKTIALPSDFVVAKSPDDGAGREDGRRSTRFRTTSWRSTSAPKTLEQFARLLAPGEDDLLERPDGRLREAAVRPGHDGRRAKLVAASKAVTVVGGGESVQAAHAAGVADKFTHVSTGGGASLEFLAEGKLPGIEALER